MRGFLVFWRCMSVRNKQVLRAGAAKLSKSVLKAERRHLWFRRGWVLVLFVNIAHTAFNLAFHRSWLIVFQFLSLFVAALFAWASNRNVNDFRRARFHLQRVCADDPEWQRHWDAMSQVLDRMNVR